MPVEARDAGLAWSKALPRVPGRARRRAGVLPSPLELRQTTALVGRFGSGKRPGRGGRLEGFPVGVVDGRSGPRRAPILALRGSPRTPSSFTGIEAVGGELVGELSPYPSSGHRALAGMAAVDGRPRTPGAAATGAVGPARCQPWAGAPPTSPSTVTIGAAASTSSPRRRLDDAVATK